MVLKSLIQAQLRAELRDKTIFVRSLPFVGLILLLFAFAFDPDRGVLESISPGLWWVTTTFASMFIFVRDAHNKREANFISQFGIEAHLLFFARIAVNFILSFLIALVSGVTILFLFSPNLSHLINIFVVSVLGTLSLSVIGSIYSPLLRKTYDSGQLLSLIVIPTVLPALLAAIQATDAVLNNDMTESWKWIFLMIIFAALYIAVGGLACDSLED